MSVKRCVCVAASGLLFLCAAGAAHAKPAAKSSAARAPADLLAAYKKEFAFLVAQKRALTQRLAALDKDNARRVTAVEAQVNALQVRLIGLRGKADGAERDLRAAERKLPADDDGDRLADTLERAQASLKKLGLTVPAAKKGDTDAQVAALTRAFALADRAMAKLGAVRVAHGHFFVADGSRVAGKLVRVGAVATFGISDDGRVAGALAPAGAGRLKLWPAPAAAATARALAAGKRPAELRLFVYESLRKNIDPKAKKTVVQFIQAGGLIGWVIVVLGAFAVLMILARVGILGAAAARGRGLSDAFESLVRIGRLDEARAAARRAGGSVGRVLRATLDSIRLPREQLEDRVSEAMLAEQPKLSRFGSAITVFAAVAPLLGLLGTVTGMISTFDIITEHGTGDPKLLSSGISEALITTELGLIVAIPTLLVGTLLGGWSSSIEGGIERSALRLVNARDASDEPAAPDAPDAPANPTRSASGFIGDRDDEDDDDDRVPAVAAARLAAPEVT